MTECKYIEIPKDVILELGSVEKAVSDGWYNEWTNDRIKGAFKRNNGTEKDLLEYVTNNKAYLVMLDVVAEKAYNTRQRINWKEIEIARSKWEN